MKKHYYINSVALLFLLSFLFSCNSDSETSQRKKPSKPKIVSEVVETKNGNTKLSKISVGSQMPHGELVDLKDNKIRTESLNGKTLVVNLWATWCNPCLTDTPSFQETASKYPDASFISVSIDKDKQEWTSFLKENNWTGNHYWIGMDDTNPFYSFAYSAINSNDVQGVHVTLPKYIIISPDGTIEKGNFSGPGSPNFEKTLDQFL